MRDQMTPRERYKAIAEGRPIDRIPHGFGLGEGAAKLIGIKVSEYCLEPKKQIEACVAAYRKYGLDSVGSFAGMTDIFGAKSVFPDYGTPYIGNTVQLTWDDLNRPYLEHPKTEPALRGFWDVLDGLNEAVGDEVRVNVSLEGPFSEAGRIIGVESLLKNIIRDPEYAHAVLSKVVETQIKLVDALEGYDLSFGIFDPVASGTLINRSSYLEFAQPYEKKLFDAMTRVAGSKPMLHICGNTSKILKDMAATGAGVLSIDNVMDLTFVKQEVGDIIPITGNVKPAETMLLGTPQDVENDLRECLRKAWDSPAGYTPSFGCGLPIETPAENLDALFDALRKYGKYPLNPELF